MFSVPGWTMHTFTRNKYGRSQLSSVRRIILRTKEAQFNRGFHRTTEDEYAIIVRRCF